MNFPHIIRKDVDPSSAPPEAGIHWINTSTNKEFFSVGITNISDWLERNATVIEDHSELNLDDGTNPHGTTKSDVGLSNVDNTSDIDKPISTLTQNALDNKQDIISAGDGQVIYKNGAEIEGVPSLYIQPDRLGFDWGNTLSPDNAATPSLNIHNHNLNIQPTEQASGLGYTFHNSNVNSTNEFGYGGDTVRAITFTNNNFSHQSEGDIGEVVFNNNYFNIGDGTNPINADGFSYSYGFGNIQENVTVTGPMQGYGYQPAFAENVIIGNDSYSAAFYDSVNAPDTSFSGHTSFTCNPIIGEIKNNYSITGLNINPSVDNFEGNAGAVGIFVGGTLGIFDTGSYQGINIAPNITDVENATGLSVDMSNATATNKFAIQTNGNVSINGALTFSGALSIGNLNAFFQSNPTPSMGAPQTIHSLVSGMVALNGVTTANADAIGVNTAMLITLEEDSNTTSGPLELGFTALALPCVVVTETNSFLDFMSGTTTAVNLDASSTGGTIETVKINRSVAIPNGVTTINNLRGFQFDLPFGDPGTITHGFYTQVNCPNYMAGSLVLGEATEVPANSNVGLEVSSTSKAFLNARMTTTQRDAMTAVNGMQVYNTSTDKLQVYAAGSWVDLH